MIVPPSPVGVLPVEQPRGGACQALVAGVTELGEDREGLEDVCRVARREAELAADYPAGWGNRRLLLLDQDDLELDFTTADVATFGHMPRRLAQQAAYCLSALELIERVGKRGNVQVYRIPPTSTSAASSAASTSASPRCDAERAH